MFVEIKQSMLLQLLPFYFFVAALLCCAEKRSYCGTTVVEGNPARPAAHHYEKVVLLN
jgi:hypothetical protein